MLSMNWSSKFAKSSHATQMKEKETGAQVTSHMVEIIQDYRISG